MGYVKMEIMRLHDIVWDALFKQNIDVELIDNFIRDQIPNEEWEFYQSAKPLIFDMIEEE